PARRTFLDLRRVWYFVIRERGFERRKTCQTPFLFEVFPQLFFGSFFRRQSPFSPTGRTSSTATRRKRALTPKNRLTLRHRIRRRRLLGQRNPFLVVAHRQRHAPGAPVRLRLLDAVLRR